MMTCHATFVAQGENIVLWTICLLVFVCVAAVQVRKNPQTPPWAEFVSHLVMTQR